METLNLNPRVMFGDPTLYYQTMNHYDFSDNSHQGARWSYDGIEISSDNFKTPNHLLKGENFASPSVYGVSKKVPRKRKNRKRDTSPSGLQRRREQNRASQRAYRARISAQIETLGRSLNQSEARCEMLKAEFISLSTKYKQLQESLTYLHFGQQCTFSGNGIHGGEGGGIHNLDNLELAPKHEL
ncbi:hypothetical protein BX600DRAFT_473413 [Xylariales sp. PMI_506]|nr:hypothetical protein BX600DRAFT_473413 [Xylariales sp. PMI_506]